jgi:hypothetical protein
MPQECTVCYNILPERSSVVCLHCSYSACKTCYTTYFMDESTPMPNCMKCHREFTRDFLNNNFTQKFINTDLRDKHRKRIIQREMSFLPATQPTAEAVKRKSQVDAHIQKLKEELAFAMAESRELARFGTGEQMVKTTHTYGRKCPNEAESCRGFLNSRWKCEMCSKYACRDCHELIGDDKDAPHECDPGRVETAKLIEQETKPCPKCFARITKIEGCDQMWCTACNDCAFSYRTGAIETVIHNPHYAEYVRNRGQIMERPIGEIRCGREIDHYMANDLERAVRRRMTPENTDKTFLAFLKPTLTSLLTDTERHTILTKISSICQGIIHLRQVELRRFMVDRLTNNTDLRVQLLIGNITEEQFNTKVILRDKKTEKYREVLLVLQMLLDSSTDVVYRFADNMRQIPAEYKYTSYDDFMTTGGGYILNEIDELRTYANLCLEKIGRKYQNKSLFITDNRWTIHML